MDLQAAKMIGAGLACSALIGAGVGIGNIFGNYLSGAMRNPSAAPGQFTVPAAMLGNLPDTGSADAFGAIVVGSLPSGSYPTFTASGLNVGLIFNAMLSAKTVAFQ